MTHAVFRATRIAPDHPGLQGKALPPPLPRGEAQKKKRGI